MENTADHVRTALLLRAFEDLKPLTRFCFCGLALWMVIAAAGCSRPSDPPPPRIAYIRGSDVPLRDQLGPSSTLTGNLASGEQVEVLAERLRWTQVRSASGRTGWVQSRFLAGPEVQERFRALAEQSDSLPSQGTAILRREANLHLKPERDAEMFYRLPEGEAVEVLAHRVTGLASAQSTEAGESVTESEEEAPALTTLAVQTLEDWLLVRGAGKRTGWLLESLADMNPPVEVAQFREGLRIRAWFVLHREMDDGIERPWYLWATMRRVAGLPYDFDEIRVFVWNPNRDRYETSYRERNLIGFYPIRVGSRETPGGPSPSFVLPVEDETGRRFEKQYVMAGRVVQRAP
jgi:hypothetical protein